jgi:Flp pilus assembly protein TadD
MKRDSVSDGDPPGYENPGRPGRPGLPGGRPPVVLVVGAVLAIATAVLTSQRVVPGGSRGVLEIGGSRRVVEAGRHFAPPLAGRLSVYPAGRAELRFPAPSDTAGGTYRVFSSEGAALDVDLTLRYEIAAEELLRYDAAAREAGGAEAPIRGALREPLRTLLSRRTAAELADDSRTASELAVGLRRPLEEVGVRLLAAEVNALTVAASGHEALARAHAASRGRRVLLLGIDAADWTIVDRLRARGELPVLDGLIRRGTSGPLRSIEPLLSPLIWTTIATGVGPEVHGILDFLVTDPSTGRQVPATSRLRRAPAFWNLAGELGKTSGIVGWLATWPAEPIEGFVVSDRFQYLAYAGNAPEAADGSVVHPPDLLDGRPDPVVPAASFDDATIRRYLNVTPAEIAAARRAGFEKGNRLNNFLHTLAAAETYAALGLDLYRTERPDIAAVYFEFLDAVKHLCMPFEPPARPGIDPADVARYGGAVAAAYRRQDAILGDFVAAADDSTVIVVVSDHGFRSGDARLSGAADMDDANAARWHLPDGVLVLAGPGVRRGATIAGARVFDIAPTILALVGCAPPASMTGRVLAEAFEPGALLPADTLRAPGGAPAGPVDVGGAAASDGPDAIDPVTGGGARGDANLGVVLAQDGKFEEAEVAFRRALAAAPGDRIVLNNLASLYIRTGRHADAVSVLEELVRLHPAYAPGWSNLGVSLVRLSRGDEALAAYDRALALEPNDQRSLVNRGFLYLDMDRPVDAEADFRRALAITRRDAGGLFGLGAALYEQGRRDEARAALEAALALDPTHRRARELLDSIDPGAAPR